VPSHVLKVRLRSQVARGFMSQLGGVASLIILDTTTGEPAARLR
jgi:hypothetical protein